MAITVDTGAIYAGEIATDDLAADVNAAIRYLDEHIDASQAWVKGALMDLLLEHHSEYVAAVDSGLVSTRKCLRAASSALGDVGWRYDLSEDDARVVVRDLFADLDGTVVADPITSSTARRSVGVAEPSGLLVAPTSALSDPGFLAVWSILSWPDYLSIAYWLRQAMKVVANLVAPQLFQGRGPIEYLALQLGGDWDRVAIAGDAFDHLGEYFAGLSDAVNDAGVDIFTGRTDGAGADAAGEFFAELVAALADQTEVYADLATKYTDAAWAAFGACQTLLSAVDALGDAVIVAAMTGKGVVEVLLAPFSLGATVPDAGVSAVVAMVEALSSAWGVMMAATSATILVGAGLGSATQQIEFIPLPEA